MAKKTTTTNKQALTKLAAKIEAAEADQQAQLLWDAWDLLALSGWADADRSARFMRCIDAEAFESAATTLLDAVICFSSGHNGDDPSFLQCEAVTAAPGYHHVQGGGWTEGLGRAACATRACTQQEEGR